MTRIAAALAIAVLATSAQAAGRIALAKTGQTASYATGDDGDLEAGIAWPSPRFTANGDGTLTDELTGLVWLIDGNCAQSVGRTVDGSMHWSDVLTFLADINDGSQSLSACGYMGTDTDWRFPNVVELESLVHAGLIDQGAWLSGEGFTRIQTRYWSSTSWRDNDLNAYFLATDEGAIGGNLKEFTNYWTLLVRAGASGASPDPSHPANLWAPELGAYGVTWPSPRLVDNGDGTVTDHLTGLMWLKDASCLGTANWATALTTVADFNLQMPSGSYACTDYTQGTYGDWRLPNRKEVFSLIDNDSTRPALPALHPFANVAPFAAFATSTTRAALVTAFWRTDTWIFSGIAPQSKLGSSYRMLPVRTVGPPQIPMLPGWAPVFVASGLGLLGAGWLRRRACRR